MEHEKNLTLPATLQKLLKSLWWKIGLITFVFGLFLINNTYFGIEPFVALVVGWILGNIVGKSFGRYQIYTSRRNEISSSAVIAILVLYFVFSLFTSAITEHLSIFPWTIIQALQQISTSGLEIVSGTVMQTGYHFNGIGMWLIWSSIVAGFSISYAVAIKVYR